MKHIKYFLIASLLLLGIVWHPLPEASALDAPIPDKGKKQLLPLFQDSIKPVLESVVCILVDDKEAALGTIVSDDGYILTKGSELRRTIKVRFHDNTVKLAKRVAYDLESDLALIKVEKKNLKPVQFLEEDSAEIGNWVATVGMDRLPVNVGVISVKTRRLVGRDERFIDNLNAGYLGIGMSLDNEDTEPGVLITEVRSKQPADKAGMKVDDRVIEIDGRPVANRQAMLQLMNEYRAGDQVEVKVKRKNESLILKATLGERKDMIDKKDRDLQNELGGMLSGRRTGFPAILQHDTVISPKDCGGPLVDLDGRVLGINIARAGRTQTWTLPSKTIVPILSNLLREANQ